MGCRYPCSTSPPCWTAIVQDYDDYGDVAQTAPLPGAELSASPPRSPLQLVASDPVTMLSDSINQEPSFLVSKSPPLDASPLLAAIEPVAATAPLLPFSGQPQLFVDSLREAGGAGMASEAPSEGATANQVATGALPLLSDDVLHNKEKVEIPSETPEQVAAVDAWLSPSAQLSADPMRSKNLAEDEEVTRRHRWSPAKVPTTGGPVSEPAEAGGSRQKRPLETDLKAEYAVKVLIPIV